jgi:hypothetical protein
VVSNLTGSVAIYQGAQGSPTYYSAQHELVFCAHDDSGNLFAPGYPSGPLLELPSGSGSFITISLNQTISVRSLQWSNGELLASGWSNGQSGMIIYRIAISGTSSTGGFLPAGMLRK